MAEPAKGGSRTDRQEFDALDPGSGGLHPSYITMRKAQWVARRGRAAVMEMAHTVTEVLRNPTAVFEGIRWDEDEDRADDSDGWRCYVGLPRLAFFNREGISEPAPDGEVFLVFVNADWVAYGWGWEEADPLDPGLPTDHGSRFCRRVYP